MSDTFPAFQQKPAPKLNYAERAKAGLLAKKPRQPVSQKPRSRIKPKSEKRKKDDVLYEKLKREFFNLHPKCQMPYCHMPSCDIHHKARRGPFLLRTDTWMAICREHHEIIEGNPQWAKERGYLLTPEQRRKLLNP